MRCLAAADPQHPAAMTARRDFARHVDVLPDVVAFVDAALAASTLDRTRRETVQFAIEELMTNMIKYAPCGAPYLTVEIDVRDGAAEVTIVDAGVDRFDPTEAPDARIDAPLAERRPGGLGLHLLRRLVDALRYDYVPARREGRTWFRVATSGPANDADR